MTPIPDVIRSALSKGEHPLWWGQPRQGFVLRRHDALAIPFSLLWCGFAIFWEATALKSNAPGFFVLCGALFVAMGIYMVVGRFFVETRQRVSTYYAVTPERVLIVSGPPSGKVSALSLKTLSDLSLIETSGGEGSIFFGPRNPLATMFGGALCWPGSSPQAEPRFELIPNAKSVFEVIRNAQQS